jgi:hypothetical protein
LLLPLPLVVEALGLQWLPGARRRRLLLAHPRPRMRCPGLLVLLLVRG